MKRQHTAHVQAAIKTSTRLPCKVGVKSLVSEYILFYTVLMAPAVEASSLSRVLSLADNPPLNPRNNAVLEIQQPLVLYIARVPGSKGE